MATHALIVNVPRNANQPLPSCYICDKPATRWVRSDSARFSAPRCYWHMVAATKMLAKAGATDIEVTRIGPAPEGLPPSAVLGTMPGNELAQEPSAEAALAASIARSAEREAKRDALEETQRALHDPMFGTRRAG